MQLTLLLAQYGYLALLIGCLLEGETLLILAGFAAHQGYLSFPLVLGVAFLGGTLGDQGFFFLGRHFGVRLIQRWPAISTRSAKVHQLLLRHQRLMIVGIRFMYGLRVAGPVIIGASKVPALTFILYNMLGAALWAGLVGSAGYLFGQTISWLFADIRGIETAALLLLAAALIIWSLCRRFMRKRH